jgi:hypothetical protein
MFWIWIYWLCGDTKDYDYQRAELFVEMCKFLREKED